MQRLSASFIRRTVAGVLLCSPLAVRATVLLAQAPVAAPAATRLIGTVKTVSATALTLTKDDGSVVTLVLTDRLRVQQLSADSTDIKAAQPATIADIAEGDRVLVAAHPDDAGAMSATRVVLMKSGSIAQSNATRQQDWQRRGSVGLVTVIDPPMKTITIASGTRKTTVQTSGQTIFRRYAPGSVKFEDAKVGTLADIAVGDQLRVRGSKDVDSGAIAADEIVSGAFRNVAGTVVSIDATAGTVTLKDLATKKNVAVTIGPESDLRNLPPEMAARFTARGRGGTGTSGSNTSGLGVAGAGRSSAAAASAPPPVVGSAVAGSPRGVSSEGATRVRPGAAGGGGDLSQVIPRLPKTTLAALKPGEAVMIVASGSTSPGAAMTAITLLSGVESLLASPEGASGFNLSPWSLGGGGESAAGGTQ